MDKEIQYYEQTPQDIIEIPGIEILPHINENIELEDGDIFNPVIVLIGPNGSGKDTLMDSMKDAGLLDHFVTATTRQRRFKMADEKKTSEVKEVLSLARTPDEYNSSLLELAARGYIKDLEPESAYVWMQWPPEGLTSEQLNEYYSNLIKKHELIEHDVHSGNRLYGLPKVSILSYRPNSHKIPIIRTELAGMLTLNELLPKLGYTPINIGVVPDSWKQIEQAIIGRDNCCSSDELEVRLKESKEQLEQYPDILNYYIHNTRKEVGGRKGLDVTVESLRNFILYLNSRKKI